jgi:hypothetical protein
VAKIRVMERDGRYTVAVEGALSASDLRRLERACARALELEVTPLVILLPAAPADAVTRAYLQHLQARGAVVRQQGPAADADVKR